MAEYQGNKPVKILVTYMNDELEIFNERQLKEMKVSDEDVPLIFGDNAYWMRFRLIDASFKDQNKVTQDCTDKDGKYNGLLEDQKRFVRAVEQGSWEKQYVSSPEKALLSVTEEAFEELRPPQLANMITVEILRHWYPGATKTRDFIKGWQEKRERLEKDTQSKSTPSTPES